MIVVGQRRDLVPPAQARPPGPTQTGWSHASPGPVHAATGPAEKVRFFASLFHARSDVYAIRWQNTVTGEAGWLPAGGAGGAKG